MQEKLKKILTKSIVQNTKNDLKGKKLLTQNLSLQYLSNDPRLQKNSNELSFLDKTLLKFPITYQQIKDEHIKLNNRLFSMLYFFILINRIYVIHNFNLKNSFSLNILKTSVDS